MPAHTARTLSVRAAHDITHPPALSTHALTQCEAYTRPAHTPNTHTPLHPTDTIGGVHTTCDLRTMSAHPCERRPPPRTHTCTRAHTRAHARAHTHTHTTRATAQPPFRHTPFTPPVCHPRQLRRAAVLRHGPRASWLTSPAPPLAGGQDFRAAMHVGINVARRSFGLCIQSHHSAGSCGAARYPQRTTPIAVGARRPSSPRRPARGVSHTLTGRLA